MVYSLLVMEEDSPTEGIIQQLPAFDSRKVMHSCAKGWGNFIMRSIKDTEVDLCLLNGKVIFLIANGKLLE